MGVRDPSVGAHLQAVAVVQQGAGGAVAALLAPPGEAGDAAGEVGTAVGAALALLALTVQPSRWAARLCARMGLSVGCTQGGSRSLRTPHRSIPCSSGSCAGTRFVGASLSCACRATPPTTSLIHQAPTYPIKSTPRIPTHPTHPRSFHPLPATLCHPMSPQPLCTILCRPVQPVPPHAHYAAPPAPFLPMPPYSILHTPCCPMPLHPLVATLCNPRHPRGHRAVPRIPSHPMSHRPPHATPSNPCHPKDPVPSMSLHPICATQCPSMPPQGPRTTPYHPMPPVLPTGRSTHPDTRGCCRSCSAGPTLGTPPGGGSPDGGAAPLHHRRRCRAPTGTTRPTAPPLWDRGRGTGVTRDHNPRGTAAVAAVAPHSAAWRCMAPHCSVQGCTAWHCIASHHATGCPAGIPTPHHPIPSMSPPPPCATPWHPIHPRHPLPAPSNPPIPQMLHIPCTLCTPCTLYTPYTSHTLCTPCTLCIPSTPGPSLDTLSTPHAPHIPCPPCTLSTPRPPYTLCPPCPPAAPQPPPGQPSVAGQGLWRWLCPEQPRPPSWGVGLLHWREASWVPAWQPGEQGDHGPQGLQPPSVRHPGSAWHCSVPDLHVLGDREQGGATCHPCAPGWSHRVLHWGWVWGWGFSPVLAVSLHGLTRLQLLHGDSPVLLPDAPILGGCCGGHRHTSPDAKRHPSPQPPLLCPTHVMAQPHSCILCHGIAWFIPSLQPCSTLHPNPAIPLLSVPQSLHNTSYTVLANLLHAVPHPHHPMVSCTSSLQLHSTLHPIYATLHSSLPSHSTLHPVHACCVQSQPSPCTLHPFTAIP